MHIGLLHSRIRVEERLLIEGFAARGIDVQPIDLRDVVFDLVDPAPWRDFDVVIDRSLSLTHSSAAVRILETLGVRCVNPAAAISTCADKLSTTLALVRAGVPTPRVTVGLSEQSALRAVEALGYPAVIKPTFGSWGRLVARANDKDCAEALIEHRYTLGGVHHHVLYAQEHIDKPGSDVRVFVVGGSSIAAIRRHSTHWVTNTARGARAEGHAVSPELADLCRRAVEAVGADIAAVDILECPRRGAFVNEINHSMEFRNSIDTTGVDIPGAVVEHVLRIAQVSKETELQTSAGQTSTLRVRQAGMPVAGAVR
ncbi:MAG: lysine biosynthesis protein LysX [Phycisphaeraceae bacterium]|nr:lysine biosynthesis protein LysX [Phycisphaeraceae bacterium]